MMEQIANTSPRAKARLAGIFELFEGLSSALGQVSLLGRLIVTGDAARTVANILEHQGLYQLGFALSILGVAFHLAWGSLFYQLFKPVGRSVAHLALLVLLICCAMQTVTALLYIAPLALLHGGGGVSALAPAQLQSLAYLLLRLNGAAFDIDLIFFGLWCILTGWLIWRSTFMPRLLGVLLAIDGLGWMLNLYTPLARQLFPGIAVASGVAEIPLMLWLLIAGVNEERWKEQAHRAT